MKMLKIMVVLVVSLALQVTAQTNAPQPTYIKGGLDIRYNSRIHPGKIGFNDVYSFIDLNISNSAVFKGSITQTPLIRGSVYGISQQSSMKFELDCFIVNPANPRDTRQVGRIYGAVPISENNEYNYANGTVKLGINLAQGSETKFDGLVLGKPNRPAGWFDSFKGEAIRLGVYSGDKIKSISIKKYDKMTFQQHILAEGPLSMYPASTVNGELLYDYNRNTWFFNNVTITYFLKNRAMVADKLSGTVTYFEPPNRKTTGESEYRFDIRFNEPPISEAALFNTTEMDESSVFQQNTTVPSLTGVMKYKDTFVNGTVTASMVQVDLMGNRLTKQQVMNVFKLVFFSSIVPFNAE
jgi:hypothetical protein